MARKLSEVEVPPRVFYLSGSARHNTGCKLITKQRKCASAGLIAQIAGAVPDLNEIRQGVGRAGNIGFASLSGSEVGTAKVEWLVDDFHSDITGDAIASALFRDERQFEIRDKPIAAIREEHIERIVNRAQVAISIGKRKVDCQRIQRRIRGALGDNSLAEADEADGRFSRVIRRLGASGKKQAAQQQNTKIKACCRFHTLYFFSRQMLAVRFKTLDYRH